MVMETDGGIRKLEGFNHSIHGGGLNVYRSLVSRIPEKQFSVIILSNGSFDWIYDLTDELVKLYIGYFYSVVLENKSES